MKKIFTLSLLFAFTLLVACKQCYNCEKKCGTCTKGLTTVAGCDGDSTLTGFSVDTWKVYLEQQGYTCAYAASVSEEACGDDDKNTLSGKGFTCLSK